MRLFRLRALETENDTTRVIQLVKNGKFWCSSFADFNDPMEGVFRTTARSDLYNLTSNKNEYKICSFTSVYGIKNPTLWGYYGGNFRGVALEILGKSDIYRIEYRKDVPSHNEISDCSLLTSLTTKLMPWKHEKEYRFIKKTKGDLD